MSNEVNSCRVECNTDNEQEKNGPKDDDNVQVSGKCDIILSIIKYDIVPGNNLGDKLNEAIKTFTNTASMKFNYKLWLNLSWRKV